jgi:O-antigen/teichoic acid export membrane protein
VRGGVVMLMSTGGKLLISTIATVVLARLLTPADFGLVAMVTAVSGLGQSFADLGLSEATIQREDVDQAQVSALFWINVGIGIVLTLVMAALAPVMVWFYREPQLKAITYALSFTFLICSLRVQHEALLKRQMRFVALAIRDVASYAVSVPLAIVVALRGGSYWALVVMPLSMNFVQMALSWLMVRWVPSRPRRAEGVGSMVAFGSHIAGSYLMNRASQNSSNALVGWWWGAAPLGLFSRAFNLLMLPVQQLSAPLGSVIVPAFSRIQNDSERFARYYLRAANLLIWATGAVFGFLFVAAKPIILLMLGRQWTEAAPVFQLLTICAFAQPLLQLTNWSLASRGESRRLLKLRTILSPIVLGSFVVGLPFGIKAVALSSAVVLLATVPWALKFAFRGTTLTLGRVGAMVRWPVALSLGGVCMAEFALRQFAPRTIFSQLGVDALAFAFAFLLSALIPAVRKEILSFRDVLGEIRLSRQAA